MMVQKSIFRLSLWYGILWLSAYSLIFNLKHARRLTAALSSYTGPVNKKEESVFQYIRPLKQGIYIAASVLSVGYSRSAYAKVRGYEAASSAFSPSGLLYAIPLLPQSALLNSLPIKNELVSEMQAYLESFVQLIDPTRDQESQIERNTSVLWTNLRVNAQRAAGMFIYNEEDLLPKINNDDSYDMQVRRREFGQKYLDSLKSSVLKLVNASRRSDVRGSLKYMQAALNDLINVAYLLVLNDDFSFTAPTAESGDFDPASLRRRIRAYQGFRLKGRATVLLTFQRPGPDTVMNARENGEDKAVVKIVVDGINYPFSAGNFIDLCQRGFYDMSVVGAGGFSFSASANANTKRADTSFMPCKIFGQQNNGSPYVDPVTEAPLRIPLEVLRDGRKLFPSTYATYTPSSSAASSSDPGPGGATSTERESGQVTTVSSIIPAPPTAAVGASPQTLLASQPGRRYTATGPARNSRVFTRAQPVLSFATFGAIGLLHDEYDLNSASGAFFWLPRDAAAGGTAAGLSVQERHLLPEIQKLNNRYSIFAFAVEGTEVLGKLRPGDVLSSAEVQEGVWDLVPPDPDTDVLSSTPDSAPSLLPGAPGIK